MSDRRGRPWTRATLVTTAAHAGYELVAGVGIPTGSVAGPVPAAAVWTAATHAGWRAAARRPASADPVLAGVNAVALAAVLGHLTGWPRRRSRIGLPVLETCEGLTGRLMPPYNAILYASGVLAVLALVLENGTAPRWVPALALATAPGLAAVQHAEHRRLVRRAHRRPSWTTRRLRSTH